MNTTHKTIVGVLSAALLVLTPFLLIQSTQAAQLRAGEQPSVPATERVSDDLYVVGGNVVSSATILGDLVVAGGNLTVNGTVSNDLLAAGGSVTVLGNIEDDLRVAGGNVAVNGTVDGDVVAGGGSVQLTGKRIGGDIVVGGGSVRIDAPGSKNARIAGGQVIINAPIAGNVEVDAEQLTLGPSAIIGGNLSYRASQVMKVESGAVVKGKTTFSPLPQLDKEAVESAAAGLFTLWMLMKFLGTLACALVLGLSFRRYGKTLASEIRSDPWSHLGRGFVALVVWPVVAVVLIVTVLGLPFGVIVLLAYVAALILASIAVPVPLGSLLYKWASKSETLELSWKTILLGSMAYFVIGLVPVLGWMACFVFFLLTLGAIMEIKKDMVKEWR